MSETGNIKRAMEELRTASEAIRDAQDSMEAANSEAMSAAGTRLKPYFDMYRRRVENATVFKLRMALSGDVEDLNMRVLELREAGDAHGARAFEYEIAGLRRALQRVRAL